MSNIQLTIGELSMLNKIANSEFRDDYDLSAPVWTPCDNNQDKGCLASLVKKGLVGVDNLNSSESTCWLTELGISTFESK